MIHEAIRMLANAYGDDTIGVNVRLDELDRDDTDKITPRVRKVITPITKEGEGIRIDPPDFGNDYPVIAVMQSAPWVGLAGSRVTTFRDGDVLLSSVYVTKDRDLWQATLDGYQTTRAMLQTLTLWMRGTNLAAYRIRNSVEVVGFSQADGAVQIGEIFEPIGEVLITLAVTTALQVKDRQTIS